MTQIQERDMMRCRSCGREERASEGYPCEGCQTFICIICSFRGVTVCVECAAKGLGGAKTGPDGSAEPPRA